MNVYIVDDEPLARAELRYLLEQTALVNICGESESLDEFYHTTQYEQVDCLFLDIELGMNNGLDLAKQLLLHEQKTRNYFCYCL
ncbi:response regulator [Lysinibacillus sp. MHQ-1]|nr:response regulator [Lysinibacillus sp. MHQ-1]